MVTVQAIKIETITDDEDGLSSLCVWWGMIGEYIALAREVTASEIECEYGDQINSFHPKTLIYQLGKRELILQLKGNEFFDHDKRIQEMIIDLGGFTASWNEIKGCLQSIFFKADTLI